MTDALATDECIICRSPFKDAYFCSDGWSYCRECILRWTATETPWRSPISNKLIYAPALLVRDERLRCLSIQNLRVKLVEAIAFCRGVEALRICGDLGNVITDTEKFETLACWDGLEVMKVDEFWVAIGIARCDSSYLLSVISQKGGAVLLDALREDLLSHRRPLVLLGVLEEMARCACEAGLCEFALPILVHLCKRSSFCDAIVIPAQQPKSRFEGRYERCFSGSEESALVFVRSRDLAQLTIPSDGSPASVQSLSGERFVLSERRDSLPFQMDWRQRRNLKATVFPDYNPDEEEASSCIEEWICPYDCSVFEQTPAYLPTETKYMPSVQREVSQSLVHAELLEVLTNAVNGQQQLQLPGPKRQRL
jgi:hypothetical protein